MLRRNHIIFALKLLVTVVLVVWIIRNISMDGILHLLSTVKVPFLLLGILWLPLDRVLMSYRWQVLLNAKQIRIPFGQVIRIYFVGAFSGNFLPSSIAPDAVRAYFASKYTSNKSGVISSVFVDRVLGLFSIAVIAMFSLLWIFINRGDIHGKTLLAILSILLLIGTMVFFERVIGVSSLRKIFRKGPIPGENTVWESVERFIVSCNEYKQNGKEVLNALLVSFLVQGLSIMAVYVISQSVHLDIALLDLAVYVPLINILIMIPVSIGGLGVQEGAFIYLFSHVGISSNAALTVALLFRVLTVAGSLPGGLFYVMDGSRYSSVSNGK